MSIDVVEDLAPARQYIASPGQTDFDYPFPIFDEGDIVIYIDETLLALSTDYTVSGVGNDTGGTISLVNALDGGEGVTVYRNTAIERLTDFPQNGPQRAAAYNDEFDRFTLIAQELKAAIARCLQLSRLSTAAVSSATMSPVANWLDKYVFVNSNGEFEPAEIVSGTISQSIIGALLTPQTAAEAAANVDPPNKQYAEGVLERYNLVGNGSTDDSTAFANAALVSAQGVQLKGSSNKTYKISAAVPVGAYFDLYLPPSSKILISGNIQGFTHNSTGVATTASSTVSSGYTLGSRSVVVADATGFAIGQYCIFDSNNASYESGSWPNNWAKITSVAGTTIEFDRPLGCDYETAVTMYTYSAASFGDLFKISGKLDLSACTYTSGGAAIDIGGYKDVDLRDLVLVNQTTANIASTTVQLVTCLDVRLSGKAIDNATEGNLWDFQSVRSVNVYDLNCDGAHFGLNVYRASDVVIHGVILNGRRQYEVDKSVTSSRSIRGIKCIGCLNVNMSALCINDYSSSVKLQSNRRVNVSNFTIRNSSCESGDIAVNYGGFGSISKQQGGNLSNFTIENLEGTGSAIGFNNPDTGRYHISNGFIRNVAGHGIFAESSSHITVSDVTVENWDQAGGGFLGIQGNGGGNFSNITFRHTDNTKPCFQLPQSGKTYSFSNIQALDGNPIFSGGKSYKNSGTATINNGATSVTVTHSLIATPTIDKIRLVLGEKSTNDPGDVSVTSISSTQFTITCRNDPGASNLDIGWLIDLGTFTVP